MTEEEMRSELEKLRLQVLQQATDVIPLKAKIAIGILLISLVCLGLFSLYNHYEARATVVSAETMSTATGIEKALSVSHEAAEDIKTFVAKADNGTITPIASYNTQASTVAQAATKTANAINSGDTSLPQAALEKTDRTTVVPNEKQQKVDVYKINLAKDFQIKAGVTVGGYNSLNVGAQIKRVELMYHKSMKSNVADSVTCMYTVAQW